MNLGAMYEKGQGVDQSHATAAKWYRKAADQGDADACFELARMYIHGTGGLPQDFAKTLELLRTAEAEGHKDASEFIEAILQEQFQREQQAAATAPPPSQSPEIPTGARVELRGLQAKPELNGRRGVVVKFIGSSGRYRVHLDEGGGEFHLKEGNMAVVPSLD